MAIAKEYHWKPLARKVIVVASVSIWEDSTRWCAYIDAVIGDNHDTEWQQVASHGEKLDERIANILFPNLKDLIWRD